jgi:hypothetical protein
MNLMIYQVAPYGWRITGDPRQSTYTYLSRDLAERAARWVLTKQ